MKKIIIGKYYNNIIIGKKKAIGSNKAKNCGCRK